MFEIIYFLIDWDVNVCFIFVIICGINKNILINSICRRYDEMVEKVSDVFDIIEEIVGF